MVLAMALQAGWRPRLPLGAALGLLGAACFVAWLTVSVAAWEARLPLPIEDYVVVLPAGLVLVSAAIADLDGRPGLLTRRWSVYLGEVSFAFYLVHYLVLAALVQGLGWRATGFADVAPVAVIFAAALGGAVLLHHLVELPCQRLLRGSRKSLGSGLGQQQPAIHGARRS
jgi:peptidoglycan/LPS O-acetylase OafA/YrhL